MALPDALVYLLDQPCDIERASAISGRSSARIIELEKDGRLHRAGVPRLPVIIAKATNWREAAFNYLAVLDRSIDREKMVGAALFRLVELCELESEFAQSSRFIPTDGSPLECYYLRQVILICPGE